MVGWTGTWNSWFGAKTDDPLAKLDPNVRKFLEQESPVKLTPAQRQQEAAAAAERKTADEAARDAAAAAAKARAEDPNAVPPESLYPDGRYAHLWKTYRARSEIEAETKTDQERLHDVLDAFKDRKRSIGLAAVENCADEQMEWSDCMRTGSIAARMWMCRDQVRRFESCYNMQTKLLKALGYLDAVDSTPETNERIQLHADKLYHQMMEQQEAIREAKEAGQPVPTFEPVIPKQTMTGQTSGEDLMSDSAKKKVEEEMKGMDDQERAAYKAAVEAEMRNKKLMVDQIQDLWRVQEAERKARIEKGTATLWDRMATAWGSSGSSSDKKA